MSSLKKQHHLVVDPGMTQVMITIENETAVSVLMKQVCDEFIIDETHSETWTKMSSPPCEGRMKP